MGRLSETMTVKCELSAVPILKMHQRLRRSTVMQRRCLPCQPGMPQAGAESHTGLAWTCNSIQDQQVQAGWCTAAAGLIEDSLMAQEENWSMGTNTRSSLPPGYRVPFTPWLKVCGHVCVCVLYLVRSGRGNITSWAPKRCCNSECEIKAVWMTTAS